MKVLKIAHENFTWSGKEIPHIGRYGGHRWQRCLAQGFGCTRSIPSKCKVLIRLARFIANISVERYKQCILPAIRLIIP